MRVPLLVPPAGAPVWNRIGRFAALAPVFLLLGYLSMRYPALLVMADNPLLVDDADDVSETAAAAFRQLVGFLASVVGVAFLLAAAIYSGVAPGAVALASVSALLVGAGLIKARVRLGATLAGAPGWGLFFDTEPPVAVEYLGLAVVIVGLGGVLLIGTVALLA